MTETRLVRIGDRVYYKPMRGKEVEATIHHFSARNSNLVIIHYKVGIVEVIKTVWLKDLRLKKDG